MNIPRQTEREQIQHLPPSTLYDLVRNESARLAARIAAMKILVEQQHPLAKRPEVAQLARYVAEEVLGGAPAPEPDPATIGPIETFTESPAALAGPFRASVTTNTMFRDEEICNIPPLAPPTEPKPKSEV